MNDYAAVLEAKGDTPNHITETRQRITAVLSGCRFVFPGDADPAKVSEWLNALRRDSRPVEVPAGKLTFTPAETAKLLGVTGAAVRSAVARHRLAAEGQGRARVFPRATVEALALRAAVGTGPQTVNHYVRAVRGFFRWLVAAKRIGANPLASLELLTTTTDVRRGRRELTPDELGAVFTAARTSGRTFRGLSGADRYTLYLTAAATGFRASALSNLTPADFALDATPPTVTLPARFNKSRKVKVQPLPADVAAELARLLADRPADAPVWGGTWARGKKAAEMLRGDLDAAGVPYSVPGPDGPLYADFHALRHSYLTLLSRNGVDLRTAQVLAGHSRPELTARYSHKSLDDLAGAVGKLPSLVAPSTVPHAPPHVPTPRAVSHPVARMCATGEEGASGGGVAEKLEMKRPGADSHRAALICTSEGDGTRTRNLRIDSPPHHVPNALNSQGIPPAADTRCTPGCTNPADRLSDLARLVQNWPVLPDHIKATVMALVNTAAPTPPDEPNGLGDDLPPGYERQGATG